MSLKPLCVSIEPFHDESLYSIVARSADANVHPNTAKLLKSAGIGVRRLDHLPFSGSDTEKTATILGLTIHEIDRRFMLPSEDGRNMVNWFGTSLERRFTECNFRRLAGPNEEVDGYHRNTWLLRPFQFCSESFRKLTHTRAPRVAQTLLGPEQRASLSVNLVAVPSRRLQKSLIQRFVQRPNQSRIFCRTAKTDVNKS